MEGMIDDELETTQQLPVEEVIVGDSLERPLDMLYSVVDALDCFAVSAPTNIRKLCCQRAIAQVLEAIQALESAKGVDS